MMSLPESVGSASERAEAQRRRFFGEASLCSSSVGVRESGGGCNALARSAHEERVSRG